jgi:Fe-S-cluster-containing dehydrogenase component
MSKPVSRRSVLGRISAAVAGLLAAPVGKVAKAAVQKVFVSTNMPRGYDPTKHKWRMAINASRCIGCGLCAEACKKENHVPEGPYYRTWVERYIITKAKPDSGEARGETLVDCPNGGMQPYGEPPVPKDEILHSFFVPKLCNLCEHSPCTQVCPVGATFESPDGAVLVDKKYCLGCRYCVQACPYGARWIHPEKHVAGKCTFCYHRLDQGLLPACVEVCPTGARLFGQIGNRANPLERFRRFNEIQVLKGHLNTEPKVFYANLDGEVR